MVTLHTFDLCKQLHALKPHWKPEDKLFIWDEGDEPEIVSTVNSARRFDEAPRFTTDYLLEKLPSFITDGFDFGMLTLFNQQVACSNRWVASYNNNAGYPIGDIEGIAETALDAVLELTIEMARRAEI